MLQDCPATSETSIVRHKIELIKERVAEFDLAVRLYWHESETRVEILRRPHRLERSESELSVSALPRFVDQKLSECARDSLPSHFRSNIHPLHLSYLRRYRLKRGTTDSIVAAPHHPES